FQPEYKSSPVATAINEKTLKAIVDALTRVPDDFNTQPKIKRIIIEHRRKVFENGGPFEWHYAELLAFGSLLLEGTPVRLSGQDSARGTFSSRHAILYDAKSGAPYVPLMHLGEKQARICIYNSLLSEAAVLGFDYGYSLDYPSMLCLWEAQFGDFANGAQSIMTQKSLLRSEFSSSSAQEFNSGKFEEMLDTHEVRTAYKMNRVNLCSGKIYYDLFNYQAEKKINDAAIIRFEQRYPVHET